ncbi:esterase/lipase family protein [Corynebacterium sp. UBA2622]|uniref:esterase/lipase family protein n=1 Tax=Corynebacterium sp. UBA2622 TaxID=1946393 RepID=UPI0025BD841B|nr:alpha/beta fold hydrolase [Corynebacterium sp. UBA2622]
MSFRTRVAAAILAGVAVLLGYAPAQAASSQLPLPQFDGHAGAVQRQGSSTMVPEGTNNPECTADEIVVLVHGTDATFYADYALIGETLARAGWCVYGIDYGYGENSYGWAPLTSSAAQIDRLVDNAMATSGATRVHMVGYSQGATVSRYWVNEMSKGRAASWFGLGSPTAGLDLPAVGQQVQASSAQQSIIAPALLDHVRGSEVMRSLTSTPTIPGVRYATFGSRFDGVLSVIDQQLPGATNIVLQDVCPSDLSGHFFLPYNPTVVEAIEQWLRDGEIGQLPCALRSLWYGAADLAIVSNFGDKPLPPPVVYPPSPS